MQSHCVEDRLAEAFDEMPMRRRRRSLSHYESPSTSHDRQPTTTTDTTNLVEVLVASAAELYGRLLRLAFPRPFTPSSQVFHWPDPSGAKMADLWTDDSGTWRRCDPKDFDEASAAPTECSSVDWLSDIDASEASLALQESVDEDKEEADESAIETRAARMLSVASYCPDDAVLVVDQYLCKCGKCVQYDVIARDVARVVTWREPEEVASVTRLLQAFSTYNEAIGYHAEMIETADECLCTWSGDEDQAFTSFVMLQDVVPFLCANAV